MKKKLYKINVSQQVTYDSRLFSIIAQLPNDYARVSAVFAVAKADNTAVSSDVVMQLSIGGREIIPKDTDLKLIEFNGNMSLKECAYDFSADKIPARNAEVEMNFEVPGSTPFFSYSIYFILEND
jgi:hypothetical protein